MAKKPKSRYIKKGVVQTHHHHPGELPLVMSTEAVTRLFMYLLLGVVYTSIPEKFHEKSFCLYPAVIRADINSSFFGNSKSHIITGFYAWLCSVQRGMKVYKGGRL